MSELVLSLFPGIGLLDRAFEEAGFCVVRGPDVLWGGDVRRFHPPAGAFAGVIGGPPCQAFSRLRHMVLHNGHQLAENLIPEYERVAREAGPAWFLMENVPAAPEPSVLGYAVHSFILNNRWVGGEQNRVRRFSFGTCQAAPVDLRPFIDLQALEVMEWAPAVVASGGQRSRPIALGRNGKPKQVKAGDSASHRSVAEALRLQGLPADFFQHSPLTVEGQQRMIGNGVPLPMGRAIAAAVRRALAYETALTR